MKTSIRQTLIHVPTEDFYWELPLKTDTMKKDSKSKVRKKVILHSPEYWSNKFNELQSIFPCDAIGKFASIAIRDANSDHANK